MTAQIHNIKRTNLSLLLCRLSCSCGSWSRRLEAQTARGLSSKVGNAIRKHRDTIASAQEEEEICSDIDQVLEGLAAGRIAR
jgi:hypothetical protein